MVSSEIIAVAIGTGIGLLVSVTIVVYKYYSNKKNMLLWSSLDSFSYDERPPLLPKSKKSVFSIQHKKEFNLNKEQDSSQGVVLQHQSRSYPGGQRLQRTPSISSQGSLDSSGNSRQGHRGSSPQIRTFAPDGKSHPPAHSDATHTSSFPLRTNPPSRSPSPLRAASLDIRSTSPIGDIRTSSPSNISLTSISSTSCSNSPIPKSLGRCLSPLLIPSKIHTTFPQVDMAGPAPPASPLGAIQPDLYTKQDGPLFIGGGSPRLGRLHFRLKYDFDRSDLVVHLIEAHDLTGSEDGGFNDPYVRLSLVPEIDSRKRQTSIRKGNSNPYFDEHFKFPVSHEELQAKSLVLQVLDYDRFSRNDIIGEVRMSMDEFNVTSSIEVWGDITMSKKPPEELQEILISLSYLPSAERLTVVVLKARNLFLCQDKETVDPFVKVYLIVNGKRSKKKKTAAKKANTDPMWNEALTFSLASSNLNSAALEVCVMDQGNDLIGSNPLVGCCVIGPNQNGPEKGHWMDMIANPRKTVSCWHTIR